MKKLVSLFLVMTLALSLCVPSLAADVDSPAPPDWCPAEEYVIFAGSQAYTEENWEKILSLREHAGAGNLEPVSGSETVLFNRYRDLQRVNGDAGIYFELALIRLKYAVNAAAQGKSAKTGSDFELAAYYAKGQEKARTICYLWNARSSLWCRDITHGLNQDMRFFVGAMEKLLADPDFTLDHLLDCDLLKDLPREKRDALYGMVFVTLDGDVVHPRAVHYPGSGEDTSTARVRDGRTMVPVRRLAELMGAVVSYDAAARQVTIQRAEDTIVMVLGSREARMNGQPIQMDVAPYSEDGRTYIPLRYIAEFFGQKVEWRGGQRHVVITEDKSAVTDSNLEAWAIAMGALLNYENNPEEADLFGGKSRFGTAPVGSPVSNQLETTGPDFGRKILGTSWGIEDREGLLHTVEVLAQSDDENLAWDLFRVSHLAQWGYLAGYVTYAEALRLIEPAAKRVAQTYSSWGEAYESYLKGYAQWSGDPVMLAKRAGLYGEMLADPLMEGILDDGLFQRGVVGF